MERRVSRRMQFFFSFFLFFFLLRGSCTGGGVVDQVAADCSPRWIERFRDDDGAKRRGESDLLRGSSNYKPWIGQTSRRGVASRRRGQRHPIQSQVLFRSCRRCASADCDSAFQREPGVWPMARERYDFPSPLRLIYRAAWNWTGRYCLISSHRRRSRDSPRLLRTPTSRTFAPLIVN